MSKQVIDENLFSNELVKTGKFSKEEAGIFFKEAIAKGIPRQAADGFYLRN